MPDRADDRDQAGPSPRGARRVVRRTAGTAAGGALILIGVPLLVLPGPGLAFVAAGAATVAWAWREPGDRARRDAADPADGAAEQAEDLSD